MRRRAFLVEIERSGLAWGGGRRQSRAPLALA
jgi:hypothetical protein